MKKSKLKIALAIHPTTHGFGWVIFDGPFSLVDWGLATVKGDKNKACIAKLESLIRRFHPTSIVLEEFEGVGVRRHERIRKLARTIVAAASAQQIAVRILTRAEVRVCFKCVGACTRYGIARAVASYLPEIVHRLPRVRKPWMSEDPRMALFAACALGVCFFLPTNE